MVEPEQQPGFYKLELRILLYIFQTLLIMSYKCICDIDNIHCVVVFIL